MNRREFLKQSGLAIAAGGVFGCADTAAPVVRSPDTRKVVIVSDPADVVASNPAAQWATGQLRRMLVARQLDVHVGRDLRDVPDGAICIVAAGAQAPITSEILKKQRASISDLPESLAISPGAVGEKTVLLASGRDARGLVYALLEIADAAAYANDPASALTISSPVVESPANRVRGMMRLFSSDIEDKPWFNDRSFWERYLTMLVSHRFNRFSLALGLGYDFPQGIRDAYFYFAYPFLLAVPGYDVHVRGLNDSERDGNLEMLRFMSDQAAARGLHFQLGIWTHAYQWTDSPDVNYTIEGLSADRHAAYCRDALQTLLRECPNIGGVTFRVHGESGVAEGSYDFWRTVFDGVVRCGRRVGIDMHAKGMDQKMIDVALATGLPITIAPKFWAEHMGLPYHQAWIRPTELPRGGRNEQGFFSRSSGSRSFLRYGYGDLLREDRKYQVLFRMWPGTQRLLLWGNPAMAAAYGRASQFCGATGLELFEPLSFKGRKGSGRPGGRDAYLDASLKPAGGDWEKYRYSYRLWGRLMYNPDCRPDVWRRGLQNEYGVDADAIEKGLGSASLILPLITTAHLPSAANNNFWPEIYTNMPIVDRTRPHPYGDTPSPKRFGTVSPLDPQLFSRVDDFAEALLKGQADAKYSPAEVAQWLLEMAAGAKQIALAGRKATTAALRRVLRDIDIQSGIARFFAWKLRAAALYAIFDRSGDASALRQAIDAYRTARDAWSTFAGGTGGDYVADITFGLERQLRGHWRDRLAAIDDDIADMEKRAVGAKTRPEIAIGADVVAAAIRAVLSPPPRPAVQITHQPPAHFTPGRELAIELMVADADPGVQVVECRLRYRHINQAEAWRDMPMKQADARRQASIDPQYTDSPYPLQYYFQLSAVGGRTWMYPGLAAGLMNQPYFAIRQTA